LHLSVKVVTVPFAIVIELSKVNVFAEPLDASDDGTLLPVLTGVEPLNSWQEERSDTATVATVRTIGSDDMRTSSPDCVASSCTLAKVTP
jgi:hypothetical protein